VGLVIRHYGADQQPCACDSPGPRPCERCGKPMPRTWDIVEAPLGGWAGIHLRPGTRFCSWACREAARRDAAPVRPTSCAQCGTPLVVKPYGRVARYCSGRCRMRALRARTTADSAVVDPSQPDERSGSNTSRIEPDLGGLTIG